MTVPRQQMMRENGRTWEGEGAQKEKYERRTGEDTGDVWKDKDKLRSKKQSKIIKGEKVSTYVLRRVGKRLVRSKRREN